ncbi:uncharacterized protein TNCV_3843421 [Trichonephila clavipes]|nr:uncharacterized protein TNCV_3843421 [Trichonephila clavipes]
MKGSNFIGRATRSVNGDISFARLGSQSEPLEFQKLHTSAFLLTLESSLKLKIDSVNFGTTRDSPFYKREVNALVRQIRIEINEHKNRTWKNLLSSLNIEDNSLYNLHKRITKKHTVIPPLHGPSGMAFSDFEKAEAFKDTLEVTFQENAEPYSDDKIEEVESLVNHYFDNFNTLTPPLTSPLEVRGTIKKLPNRKSPGPNQIPNIALKYLPINAITHLTKIYNRRLTH